MKVRLLGVLFAATVFAVSLAFAQTNQPSTEQTSVVQEPIAQTSAHPMSSRRPTNDQAIPDPQNAGRKLGRGVANLLFGIVEVPNQITHTTAERGGAAGSTFGVGKGLMRWIGRELTGVYEIVTFPLPLPKGYKPIMKPEWPNEDYDAM
jgi:putative exosortase-associated protein (TIGR04073 family)